MRTAALVVALAAVLATTASARPSPRVERARADGVAAKFSYVYDRASFRFSHQRLTIRRRGAVRFAATIRRRPCAHCLLQPANYFSHGRSLSVRDLDADVEPEVVLDLYWGGAHCCWFTKIFRYLPRVRTYRALTHVWGNLPYRLRELDGDGAPELVAHDDRFSYAFASFADSRWPIRILRYRHGTLRVVTRTYPRRVERHAAALWREARSRGRRAETQGILAAWAADECLLGRAETAFSRLRRSPLVRGDEPRARYLRHLRRFLRRTGYL